MTKTNKREYKRRNPFARALHTDGDYKPRVTKMKNKILKPITVKEATRILQEEDKK